MFLEWNVRRAKKPNLIQPLMNLFSQWRSVRPSRAVVEYVSRTKRLHEKRLSVKCSTFRDDAEHEVSAVDHSMMQ